MCNQEILESQTAEHVDEALHRVALHSLFDQENERMEALRLACREASFGSGRPELHARNYDCFFCDVQIQDSNDGDFE